MDEEGNEWSDLTCTAVLSLVVLVIFLPMMMSTENFALVLATYSALVASYAGLIKIYGSNSVIEMGLVIVILSILIAWIIPDLI